MKPKKNSILAVIDPTRTEQWALRKALSIASSRDDLDVRAILCVYSNVPCDDPDQLQAAELKRHQLWLDALLEDFATGNVTLDSMVVWAADWRNAICDAGATDDIVLVVKRASGRQHALASSDRHMIRNLGNALLLVKNPPAKDVKKILIAVDFNAADDSHKALKEAIISIGTRMRGTLTETELHTVSAYPAADSFVHPPDIAKLLKIDRAQAHVRRGPAVEVIPDVAKELDPDLVIVGNVGRRGLSGITIGNTAEKILTDIESDVLVLVQEEVKIKYAA